jgi:hypothetical protein
MIYQIYDSAKRDVPAKRPQPGEAARGIQLLGRRLPSKTKNCEVNSSCAVADCHFKSMFMFLFVRHHAKQERRE